MDPTKIHVIIHHEGIVATSAKSIKFLIGEREEWLPRKCIILDLEKNIVSLPTWLAKAHDLMSYVAKKPEAEVVSFKPRVNHTKNKQK